MLIYYSSEKQKKFFDSFKELSRKYGSNNAKQTRRRFDDLQGAANLEVMKSLPGGTHELQGDRADTIAIDLHKGRRLIFEPSDNPPPRKPDGGLDWFQITAIRILEVEDYHD